jgi:hypothetical protein
VLGLEVRTFRGEETQVGQRVAVKVTLSEEVVERLDEQVDQSSGDLSRSSEVERALRRLYGMDEDSRPSRRSRTFPWPPEPDDKAEDQRPVDIFAPFEDDGAWHWVDLSDPAQAEAARALWREANRDYPPDPLPHGFVALDPDKSDGELSGFAFAGREQSLEDLWRMVDGHLKQHEAQSQGEDEALAAARSLLEPDRLER